jgi:predicted Ser/Thr protein kinase
MDGAPESPGKTPLPAGHELESAGVPAESSRDVDDGLIGRLAVEQGLLSPQQLRACLDEQQLDRRLTLGELLVRRAGLRVDQLIRLVAEHRSLRDLVPDLPRYEVRGRLGEGSSAIVYRAWDRELNRPVALKVLRDAMRLSPVARQRFELEARAAASISHPNIVTIHDAGESGGHPYLVMELVEGRPLNEVAKGARWDERTILELIEKVARGLASSHEKGVIHRDLKPANIIISPDGEPKVGDFGLAHVLDSGAELTRTGTAVGTPLYMSPEQVRGESRAISPRTDVYALGTILYELVVGVPPHLGASVQEIYDRIVRVDPLPPRKVKPGIPRDLETLILKALDKTPGQRYENAQALADDLRRYLRGEPLAARPLPGTARLWRKAVRHRLVVISVAAALLGSVVGAWAIVSFGRRGIPAPPAAAGRLELDAAYYGEFDHAVPLLPLVSPSADRISGEWRRDGSGLLCGSQAFTRLQLPYAPPAEYDLLVVFTRKAGSGDINILLAQKGHRFLWAMGAMGNQIFGFGIIGGAWADANPTTRRESPCLAVGVTYTVVVQVRENGVWAYVNGKLKSSWITDYSDMGLEDDWALPQGGRIGLGTYESPTEFHRIDLLEVTGRGRILR